MSDAFERPASSWLRLPAWLYGAAIQRRNRRFDAAQRSTRASVPVISVGNLTVGGTGKTPLVEWIARRLLVAGRRPAVVSRGYGGRGASPPLVVSDGSGPLVDGALCGDEPLLLARSLPGVGVIVDPRRTRGAARAAELGYDVIVLDDGFQHRQLARDLDLCLLDAARPFGNGHLLPAGPLRESRRGLARADAIVATGWRPGLELDEIRSALREAGAPGLPLLRAARRPAGWVDLDGRRVSAPERVVAFCGIAKPERFRDDLLADGRTLVEFIPFRDHHRFTMREIARLARRARDGDAVPVTTEKDLARLAPAAWRAAFERGRPWAMRLEVDFVEDDARVLEGLVERAVGGDRSR